VSGRRDGGDIALAVADRGIGIPAEDRERVKQRFVRLETSRTEPGSGLGLSLVAAVARLHGGTLELGDAAPGLVATLRLPADKGEDGGGDGIERNGEGG
jgi:signal transduction histidine kinase